MIWGIFKKNNNKDIKREEQDKKILLSQQFLMDAAMSTAETAREITAFIKQQLLNSQAELSSTVKIIQDALIISNEKNEIIGFNPAAENIFDCKAETVLGKNLLTLFVQTNNKPIDEGNFWSILKKEEVWDHNFDGEPMKKILGKRQRGETFWIDLTVSELPLHDEKKFLFIVRDLNSEMRIRQSEFDHKSIFHNSKDSILILHNHKILKTNKTFCDLLGVKSEEIEGGLFEHLIEFEERENVFNIQEKHLSGNISNANYAFTLNYNNIKLKMVATEFPFVWQNKKCILCTLNSSYEMEIINNFLKLDNNQFCNVSDNTPDLVCIFDKDLKIKYVNNSFKEFYQTNDLDLISDYLPFTRRNNFTQFLKELVSTKRNQFSCRNGDRENIQDWCFYPIVKNNEIVEYHGIGRDITHIINEFNK
jgi:PAS domain S-box-containing protein